MIGCNGGCEWDRVMVKIEIGEKKESTENGTQKEMCLKCKCEGEEEKGQKKRSIMC